MIDYYYLLIDYYCLLLLLLLFFFGGEGRILRLVQVYSIYMFFSVVYAQTLNTFTCMVLSLDNVRQLSIYDLLRGSWNFNERYDLQFFIDPHRLFDK